MARKNRSNKPSGKPPSASTDTQVQSAEGANVNQLQTEFIAAITGWSAIRPAVIPTHSDSIRVLPVETIQMMASDPVIDANDNLLKELVLADGVQIVPKVDDEEDSAPDAEPGPNTKKAMEYAAFIARNLEQYLETPIREVLEGMLDGIRYGNKIAEHTFELAEAGRDKGKLVSKYLKVKNQSSLQFVVDKFWNIVGFRPSVRVNNANGKAEDIVLPRIKFLVFTYHKENADPRGRSGWRSIFGPWKFKQITWPILERFLKQCAIPGLIGKASATAKTEALLDASGKPVIVNGKAVMANATQVVMQALMGYENSSVIACAAGTEVEQIQTETEGALFTNVIDMVNREITQGQLRSTRATSEAQHGSKADSETSLDLLSTFVWYLKGRLIDMLRADYVKALMLLNYGPESLEWTPDVMMGDSDRYDWADDAAALAQLAPLLTDSQFNALCQAVGIEPPLAGEERPSPEAAKLQQAVDPATGKPIQPAPNDPKQPKNDPKPKPKVYRRVMGRDVISRRSVSMKIPLRLKA